MTGKDVDKIERLLKKAEALSPGWYEPHYQLGVVYEAPEALCGCDPGDEPGGEDRSGVFPGALSTWGSVQPGGPESGGGGRNGGSEAAERQG